MTPNDETRLRLIQRAHARWQEKHFPDTTSTDVLLGVGEEVGELMHAHLKSRQGIRYTPAEIRAMKVDAVADVVIYLMAYCTLEGIDLSDAIEETWAKVESRDWSADPIGAASE